MFSCCRKIVVFDTSPSLFNVLLDYLYSGQLETGNFTVEQLAELMLLADRYQASDTNPFSCSTFRTFLERIITNFNKKLKLVWV